MKSKNSNFSITLATKWMYEEIFKIFPSRLFSKIDDYIQNIICKIIKLNMRKIFIFDSIGRKISCFQLHAYF